MGYTSAVRKCIHIEIITKFNLIHEKEWTGDTVSNICKRYGTSRKTYYKWNNRYKQKGIEGLLDNSKRPHNTPCRKVTSEIEETILDLRRLSLPFVSLYESFNKFLKFDTIYICIGYFFRDKSINDAFFRSSE